MKRGSPTLNLSINVYHVLYGEKLADLGKANIIVENGVIKEIREGWSLNPDLVGGVALPLPVNAHVHLNDYRIPEHCYGLTLEQYVGSKGLKLPLIRLYKEPLLSSELIDTLIQYRLVVDYQEIPSLCSNYMEVLRRYDIEYIGLSRPMLWDEDEIYDVVRKCSGLGIANPTRVPSHAMPTVSRISYKHVVSAHVSETKHMEERGGLHYLLSNRVRLRHVVHGTFLEDWELKLLADNDIVLIVNPRSNLWFTGKLPNLRKALEYGVKIALGTDNAGCFHPDIWIEGYLLTKLLKINPRKVLEMVLLNGYYAVGEKPFYLREDEKAYFMIVDLGLANERSKNIYFSILSRILWSREKIIVKYDRVYYLTTKLRNTGVHV